jgi:hypothetical protein
MRVIDVTRGESEPLTVLVEDEKGRDLSTATVQVALGGAGDPPTVWLSPSDVDTDELGKLRVTLQIGTGAALVTRRWVWVKLSYSGAVRYLRASNEAVTVR